MTRTWHELKHPRVPCGKYEITKSGEVRNSFSKHVLTNSRARGGYTQVCLTVAPRKTLSIRTHRLVAETFLPNPNGYGYINHLDEDKTNNKVGNLEWCSMMHNNHYSKTGYYKSLAGKGVGNVCRFTAEDIDDMKMFRRGGVKLKDIARVYRTSNTYVCNLTRGKVVRAI